MKNKKLLFSICIAAAALTCYMQFKKTTREKKFHLAKKTTSKNTALLDQIKIDLKKDPANSKLRFKLAKLYFDNKEDTKASKELFGVLDSRPRHFKALSLLGMISYRQGNKAQARWFWRSALDAKPDSKTIKGLLYQLDVSEAKKNNLNKKDRLNSTLLNHYIKGDRLYQEGKLEEALEELSRAVKKNTNDSRTYFLIGTLYREKNDLKKTEKYWKRALEINPYDSMLKDLLHSINPKISNQKKIDTLLSAIKENPLDIQNRLKLAEIYTSTRSKEDRRHALSQLKEILKIDPSKATAYLKIASLLDQSENFKEALDYYKMYANKNNFKNKDEKKFIQSRIKGLKKYLHIISRNASFFQNNKSEENEILIPKGEFTRGDRYKQGGGGVDEEPPRKIFLPDFYIDQFEITHRQYKKFIDKTEYKSPIYWKHKNFVTEKGLYPVVYVSWYDAASYCKWAGKKLPSETQWEKAARGTDARRYPWGDEFDNDNASTGFSLFRLVTPVGSYPNGVSPYNVHNMAANVHEWVFDWYKAYPGSTLKRKEFGERFKVTRGGKLSIPTFRNCENNSTRGTTAYPYP